MEWESPRSSIGGEFLHRHFVMEERTSDAEKNRSTYFGDGVSHPAAVARSTARRSGLDRIAGDDRGSWSPTRNRVVHKMLDLAKIQPGDVLVDLGAGDGRILLEAVRRYGIRVVGIEIDPLRWAYCRLRLLAGAGRRLASVRMANFFDVDLSFATVVTFYLSQAAADKLKENSKESSPAERACVLPPAHPGMASHPPRSCR